MELTKRQAVEKSVEMWTWLAETGEEKEDWMGWKKNGGKYPKVAYDCFLCEYIGRREGDTWNEDTCELCPYRIEYGDCTEDNSLYLKWEAASTKVDKRKCARRFRSQLEEILEGMEEPTPRTHGVSYAPWGHITFSEPQPPITELAEWCEKLIAETCDSECPHCNRPINLPDEEDIEKWLKGDK